MRKWAVLWAILAVLPGIAQQENDLLFGATAGRATIIRIRDFALTGAHRVDWEFTVAGDINDDDVIDDADLLQVLFAFGQSGANPADVNGDSVVDDADLLMVLFNFGATGEGNQP